MDLSNDTDPAFMAEFYTNIKILNQDLYKKTTVAGSGAAPTRPTTSVLRPQTGAAESKPSSRMLSRSDSKRNVLSRGESHNATRQQSSSHLHTPETARAAPSEYFTSQHMQDRVRQYAQEAGIPSDYLERYSQEAKSLSTITPAKSNAQSESLKRLMAEE